MDLAGQVGWADQIGQANQEARQTRQTRWTWQAKRARQTRQTRQIRQAGRARQARWKTKTRAQAIWLSRLDLLIDIINYKYQPIKQGGL